MKYARFINKDGARVYGVVEGETIAEIEGAPWQSLAKTGSVYELGAVKLCAPSSPRVIMCAGTNYMDHIREVNEGSPINVKVPERPLIFSKGPNTIADPGQGIEYPSGVERVDYEAELAVIIGKKCKKVTEETALGYCLGFTCLNDVSARDWQWSDGQWTRGKGPDTFCPLGPIVTDEIDPSNVAITTRVNGEVRQSGNTKDMIFSVPALISFISQWITLEPGDVIATGTPSGVGPIHVGDIVEIEIEGIGVLSNPVVAS